VTSKLRVFGLAALCFTFVSSAMGDLVVTIDENGNGTQNGTAMPGALGTDPLNNLTTLIYNLPTSITPVPGDVLILEPTGAPSDLLRFVRNQIIVYSDVEAPEPPFLADVGIPTDRQTNLLSVAEVGGEGFNGLFPYTPTANQPGFVASFSTYTFISDVPEPSSLLLLGSGLVAGLVARRLLQRKA
jgi:hypothetical protein